MKIAHFFPVFPFCLKFHTRLINSATKHLKKVVSQEQMAMKKIFWCSNDDNVKLEKLQGPSKTLENLEGLEYKLSIFMYWNGCGCLGSWILWERERKAFNPKTSVFLLSGLLSTCVLTLQVLITQEIVCVDSCYATLPFGVRGSYAFWDYNFTLFTVIKPILTT
jgi:hypothetical protein